MQAATFIKLVVRPQLTMKTREVLSALGIHPILVLVFEGSMFMVH